MIGLLLCFLCCNDTLMVINTGGVYMFESVPVKVSVSMCQGIKARLDLTQLMFYEDDTVKIPWRQKVVLLRTVTDFNNNVWGEVIWQFRECICDTLPILDTVQLKGFVIIKNGKTGCVYLHKNLKTDLVSCCQMFEELPVERNFTFDLLLVVMLCVVVVVVFLYLKNKYNFNFVKVIVLLLLLVWFVFLLVSNGRIGFLIKRGLVK